MVNSYIRDIVHSDNLRHGSVQPSKKNIDQVNSKQNSEQNQRMVVQQQIPPLYSFGFIAHFVYGGMLGGLMSLFVLMGSGSSNNKKNRYRSFDK